MKVEFIVTYTVAIVMEDFPDSADPENLPEEVEDAILNHADDILVSGAIKPQIIDYYMEEK